MPGCSLPQAVTDMLLYALHILLFNVKYLRKLIITYQIVVKISQKLDFLILVRICVGALFTCDTVYPIKVLNYAFLSRTLNKHI